MVQVLDQAAGGGLGGVKDAVLAELQVENRLALRLDLLHRLVQRIGGGFSFTKAVQAGNFAQNCLQLVAGVLRQLAPRLDIGSSGKRGAQAVTRGKTVSPG